MKRAVIAVCAAAMALATPVTASADIVRSNGKMTIIYGDNGIIKDIIADPTGFEHVKLPIPDDPFRDDAPSYDDLIRQSINQKNNEPFDINNAPSVFDSSNVIEIDEPEEGGIPLDHIYMFTRYEYTVVAVNPKMKRYMAKSVMNTNVKMRKNVIFTQDYVVADKQLKIGDKIYLTFDEDESDGMTSDRQDFLVFAIPKEEYNSNLDFEVPARVQNIFIKNNVFVWGISKGVKM